MGRKFAETVSRCFSMTFIARIFRFLFWLLVVSWSVALLRRVVGRMAMDRAKGQPDVVVPPDTSARKLVRDPVCGMHMAETIAIPLRSGGELLNFCSLACRDKYLSGSQKLAANG
jgi:YHS domain-containing protein